MRIEAGLILLILVLAVWTAADLAGRLLDRRRCDRFIGDLRTFSAAFQRYGHEVGFRAPADPAVATLPPVLAARLHGTGWTRETPFGGRYEWAPPGSVAADGAAYGAIRVTAFAPGPALHLSRTDLLRIDARLDDGNLATGRFRAGFDGWPVYLIPK